MQILSFLPGWMRAVRLQLFVLSLALMLRLCVMLGVIPSEQQLITTLMDAVMATGWVAIAGVSFAENVAGFNAYFPGSIAILGAMSATAGHPRQAVVVFSAIVVGGYLAHILNFCIGRASRVARRQVLSWYEFALAFWHPHLAAITCLRAGATEMTFVGFLCRLSAALMLWYTIWAVTMYSAGHAARNVGGLVLLFYVYLIGWLIVDTVTFARTTNRRESKRSDLPQNAKSQ